MISMEDARTNIGQPFKWQQCVKWDVIREVTEDGYIIGDFLTAPIEDCRLKEPVPPQFKKEKPENENKTD